MGNSTSTWDPAKCSKEFYSIIVAQTQTSTFLIQETFVSEVPRV